MKSKTFSKYKRLRCPTKALQKDIKNLKKFRSGKDRKISKVILKKYHDDTKLPYTIKINNGSRSIV